MLQQSSVSSWCAVLGEVGFLGGGQRSRIEAESWRGFTLQKTAT